MRILVKIILIVNFGLLTFIKVNAQSTFYFPKNNSYVLDTVLTLKWNMQDSIDLEVATDGSFSNNILSINAAYIDSIQLNSISFGDTIFARIKHSESKGWQDTITFYVFHPTLISSISNWYSPDSVHFDISNKIDTVYDLISGSHFFQTNSSNTPELIDSIFASPCIYFNGNQYLKNTNPLFPDDAVFSSSWLFLSKGTSSYSGVVTQFNQTGNDKLLWRTNNVSKLFEGKNFPTTVNDFDFSYNYENGVLVSSISNGNSNGINTYINGSLYDNSTLVSISQESPTVIGSYYASSPQYFFKGYFTELLMFSSPISEEERILIENYLKYKYTPPVNLGADISIQYGFCPIEISINEGYFKSFEWSNGSTSSSIEVTESGKYSVTATDYLGNISSDEIIVSYPSINNNLNDTTICFGDSVLWNPNLPQLNYTFNWNNGFASDTAIYLNEEKDYYYSVTDTNSCSYLSDTIQISVDSFPLVNLLPDTLETCLNQKVFIENQEAVSYLWSNDSTTPYFTVDSEELVFLTVTNETGCSAIDSVFFDTIGTAPFVDFSYNQTCSEVPILFIDETTTESGELNSWMWTFGQGDTSHVQDPSFVYLTPSDYNVCLTVETSDGCQNKLCDSIVIDTTPKAEIMLPLGNSFCNDIPVPFNIMNQNMDNLNYLWDFDDGNFSNIENPEHSYIEPSSYNVVLQTESANGCANKDSVIIEIGITDTLPKTFSLIDPIDSVVSPNDSMLFTWETSQHASFYRLLISSDTIFEQIRIDTVLYKNNILLPLYGNAKTFWKVQAFNNCNQFIETNFRSISKLNIPFGNLLLWVNTDSLNDTLTYLSEWVDQSGNSNNFYASESVNRPFINSNLFNKKSISFNGVNQFLYTDTNLIPEDGLFSIFIPFTWSEAPQNYAGLLTQGKSGVDSSFYFRLITNDSLFSGLNTNTETNNFNFSFKIGQGGILSFINDTTEYGAKTFINNKLKDTSTLKSITKRLYTTIGNYLPNSSLYPFKGDIPEIIIFDTIISDSLREHISQYLRYKYAPPVNLLYNIYVPYGFPDTTITTADKGWFTDFQWSTGPDDTLSTLTVSEEGTYAVTVTDIFGFESSDSLRVFYPEFNVWNDRSICLGDTLVWDLEPKGPYAYAWSTGSSDSAIAISEAGTYSVTITDTLGNSWSPEPVTVSIDSFPATATLGPDTTLCSGNRLELASGQGAAADFLWHDGSTQPYYLINGAETISVEVTNDLGCTAWDTITVDVAGTAPTANFSYDRLCRDISINFTDLSEAYDGSSITGYTWNFNELGSSDESNPTFAFADTGEVAVTLSIETDEGCANDTTQALQIHALPQPAFNPQQVCENATLQLQNQSTSVDGAIESYSWQIGDNQFTGATPTITFSEAGDVQVQMVAITEHNCPDTLHTSITVRPAPTANFNFDTACVNREVHFSNISTTNLGQQYSSQWTLEEGVISESQHPNHIYNSIGEFNVKLVVQQLADGCTDTLNRELTVHALPEAIISDQTGCQNTIQELQHASTWGEGEQKGTVRWLIADTLITGEPAYYSNPETGTQTLQLIATNGSGCSDTANYEYMVNPTPSISFAPVQDTLYTPSSVNLTNTSDPAQWEWFINGDFFSSESEPVVEIDSAGIYIFQLKGIDDNGCSDTFSDTAEALVPLIDASILECRAIIDQGRLYVSVDLANIGSKSILNPELRLTLSNGQMFAENYSGTIYPGDEDTYSFRTQYLLPDNTTLEWIITELIYESDQVQANNSCTYIFGEMPQIFNPYPNPVDGTLHLDFTAVDQGNARLRLYNLMGEIVMDKTIEANKGLNRLQIPNPSPNGGVHTLEVTVNGTRKTFRIVL